jgi:RNA polymerase sigma-70 factor, ECF subfamily
MSEQGALVLPAVPTDDVAPGNHHVAFDAERDGDDAVDAQVVVRVQRGDLDAFVALYERHFSRVYGYLRVLLRDHHEAEDLTQQTFTKAYQALPGFQLRAGKPFRCWLFRIARNEALSHLRKHGRIDVEQTDRIEMRIESPSAPNALSWLSDAEILLFVERLPCAQRQVLMMRYGLSLTTQEVADVLARTPVAVRKLEHRALRFLEVRLESIGRRSSRTCERTAMLVRLRRAPVLGARRFALVAPSQATIARPVRW